jgi:hypothetical protein
MNNTFFGLAGILVGGFCAGWFMNGRTDFLVTWTIGGIVAGFFVGMASAAVMKALICRFFENEWPTLY